MAVTLKHARVIQMDRGLFSDETRSESTRRTTFHRFPGRQIVFWLLMERFMAPRQNEENTWNRQWNERGNQFYLHSNPLSLSLVTNQTLRDYPFTIRECVYLYFEPIWDRKLWRFLKIRPSSYQPLSARMLSMGIPILSIPQTEPISASPKWLGFVRAEREGKWCGLRMQKTEGNSKGTGGSDERKGYGLWNGYGRWIRMSERVILGGHRWPHDSSRSAASLRRVQGSPIGITGEWWTEWLPL